MATRTIGLRPGEKLREELWDDAEGIGPTEHDKIRVVRKIQCCATDFDRRLQELISLAEKGDEAATRDRLARLAESDGAEEKVGASVDGA